MRDAGHRTAEKAKIIYPPPPGVDIIKKSVGMVLIFQKYFQLMKT